jgi:hypothetical protein
VIDEQLELYRTITGEHRVPPPVPESEAGAQVVPLRRRREGA